MVNKYARLLEQRQINNNTGEVWALDDVPNTWKARTKTKVEGDGYEFGEDGTAHKVEPNDPEE